MVQLHTFTKANHNREARGDPVLHLDDGVIIALCLPDICHIILQLKAWQVVIDVLQNQVDGHEGAGGRRLCFHHQAESRCFLKVETHRVLNPDFT